MARKFNIDYHTVQLLLQEPFWGHISRRISKIETDKIPTAGVTVKDGDLRMYYNPDFCQKLVDEEGEKKIVGLLKHELCHLFYEHVTSRKRDPAIIHNYATDLAINSPRNIPRDELPSMGLFPGERPLGKDGEPADGPIADLIEQLEPNLSSDLYFEKLKEIWPEPEPCPVHGDGESGEGDEGGSGSGEGDDDSDGDSGCSGDGGGGHSHGQSDQQCTCQGHGTLDDHDGWDQIDETDRELVRGKVKQIVKEAVKECDKTNRWGSVSAELRSELRKLISDQVNWKALLRAFVGRCQRADATSTRKRRNRKYGLVHPGVKRSYTANIMVAVDMSGSVSDAELELLYGELNGLAKKATFTFVPFDSAIDEENIFVWKKGKKAPPKRFRAGGTCFNAPVNWANERRGEFDALLILTDGYAPKPGACKLRTGWIITPDGEMGFDVGTAPVIKLQHKAKGLAA